MIFHPITNIKYELNSKNGREILYNYVENYKSGGMLSGIKDSIYNVFEKTKSMIFSTLAPDSIPTPYSIMNNTDDSIVEDVSSEEELSVPAPILQPPNRNAYKLFPLREIISKYLDINIQITREIISETDFWKDELENVIHDWEEYSSRSSSPVFGRLSPSLLPDFNTKRIEAIERLQTLTSPNGYRLQTTIDGDLDGYFINPIHNS